MEDANKFPATPLAAALSAALAPGAAPALIAAIPVSYTLAAAGFAAAYAVALNPPLAFDVIASASSYVVPATPVISALLFISANLFILRAKSSTFPTPRKSILLPADIAAKSPGPNAASPAPTPSRLS